MSQFVTKHQITECLNLKESTLKKYRLRGEWIEGIHWVRINSRCTRYNLHLIQDWIHNRHNPAAHQQAIAHYQQELLGYQQHSLTNLPQRPAAESRPSL